MNIPYGKQTITENDINAVVDVLKSDYLTCGPIVEEFENKFANFTGAKFAVAVSNGTAALHLSALALGVKTGSNVITSPITFAASANCVEFCDGNVLFCDIDPKNYCLSLDKLKNTLETSSEKINGVITVNYAGFPQNLEELKKLSDKYDFWIIEDACHSPGAEFLDSEKNWQICGNGKFADTTVFSFHPVKHIACGEGGMITTNNEELYNKIKLFRSHGITKDPSEMSENHGGWYQEMITLGYNYRLSDIQCALGISQLTRINENVEQRRKIASMYNTAFEELDEITTPFEPDGFKNSYHLYVIQIEKRKKLYDFLKEKGIFTQVHYIPLHQMPYYKNKYPNNSHINSETFYSKCLSLPMYSGLKNSEQEYVINSVLEFISANKN